MVGTTQLACPRKRCNRAALRTNVSLPQCGECRGVWIPEAALHARITSLQRRPPQLEWRRESRAAVLCLVCKQGMDTLLLYDIPVDRCKGHGIWLDGGELEGVLAVCQQDRAARGGGGGDTVVVDLVGDAALATAEVAVESAYVATEMAAFVGDQMRHVAGTSPAIAPGSTGGVSTGADLDGPEGGVALGAAVAADPGAGGDLASLAADGAADGAGAIADGASAAGDGAAAVAEGTGGALEAVGDVLGAVGSGTVQVLGVVGEGLIAIPGALLEGLGSILDF